MATALHGAATQGDEQRPGIRHAQAASSMAGPAVQPKREPRRQPSGLDWFRSLYPEHVADAACARNQTAKAVMLARARVDLFSDVPVLELVEPRGIEPLTFAMPLRRSPS